MQHREGPNMNGHAPLRPRKARMRTDIAPPAVQSMGGLSMHRLRIMVFGTDPGGFGSEPLFAPAPSYDSAPAPIPAPRPRMASRRLYADPGPEVIVAWGDVRELLTGQLAHPERLRDAHRLRCRAQVYEALAPQRCEALAAAMLGDASFLPLLHPLTDDLAAKLNLSATLPPKPALPPQRREPGFFCAGDRLVRLLVAGDPTTDGRESSKEPDEAPPRPAPRQTRGPAQPVSNGARSGSIPQHYLKEWEFRRSREEAIYQMHFETSHGWLQRLLRALFRRSVSRREFFRWQIMLSGKSADDQLWSVRPPQGALGHPRVREWAARTLGLAGYDPALMLVEWEIYWRRKAD